MKKSIRKLASTVVLALMVLACLPIQAYAAEGFGGHFMNNGNTGYLLNAATNGTPGNGTRVTVWRYTGHKTQEWDFFTYFPGTNYRIFRNAKNTDVVLSYSGATQATLTTYNSSKTASQAIKMVNEGKVWNGFTRYGLVLPNYVLCATASGYSNGRAVNWDGPTGRNNQLWELQN